MDDRNHGGRAGRREDHRRVDHGDADARGAALLRVVRCRARGYENGGLPASSDGAIAVGAYYSRFDWTDENGDPADYGVDYGLGDLAFFSNHGPRPDGRLKPEITAPGFGIAAALSKGSDIALAYADQIVEDGEHIVLQGTSMASPHAAGAAALILAEEPNASPEDVLARFAAGAMTDEFTGEVPNGGWGYGKLDVYGAVTAEIDGDDDSADDDDDSVGDDDSSADDDDSVDEGDDDSTETGDDGDDDDNDGGGGCGC
ncbi:MAG: S8 family serine peptidase [Deltaproteobacteria bacterium]|nr:S8 family serine peptidase [Deltaproteobacteria bacterium]